MSLFLLAGIHFDNVTTDNDALGMITRQRGLNFPPGSDWEYSGSGYFLLSLVVKRVSGKSLKEFAQDNIFRPLAMRHTQYRDDHTSLIPHRVLAYDRDEKGVYTLSVSYAETTGDGMVQSSIEDMQKWDENFYSGQVGGKGFVAEMEVPAKLNKGVTVDYAKGLFLDEYRGLRMIWHSGGSGGYRALLSRFPEQHLSIACLCNLQTVNRSKRVRAVAETYLSEKMKPKLDTFAGKLTPRQTGPMEFELEDPTILKVTFEPPRMGAAGKLMVFRFLNFSATFEAIEEVKPTAAELATYAGDYWSDELRVTYRLMMQNGSLWMKALIGADGIVHTGTVPFSEMRPALRDEFVLSEAPLIFSFTRDAQHSLTGFTLNGFLEHGMLFARLRDKN